MGLNFKCVEYLKVDNFGSGDFFNLSYVLV